MNKYDDYQLENFVRKNYQSSIPEVYMVGRVIQLTDNELNDKTQDELSERYSPITLYAQELLACGMVPCTERSDERLHVFSLLLPQELRERIGYFEVILDWPNIPLACYDYEGRQIKRPVMALHSLQNLYREITGQVLVIEERILRCHD